MIVVVEGPSAAGKTTWVRAHHPTVAVWEPDATEARSFADGDERVAAAFWAEVHLSTRAERSRAPRERASRSSTL